MSKQARIAVSVVGGILYVPVAYIGVGLVLLLLSPWPCEEVNCGSGPVVPAWLEAMAFLTAFVVFVIYVIACVRWIARR